MTKGIEIKGLSIGTGDEADFNWSESRRTILATYP